MKKTIAILLILISSLSYSQRNPANFRYGVKTNKIEFTQLTNTEITSIVDPEEGTHVYSSTDNELKVFKNGFWVSASPQGGGSTQGLESVLTENSDLTTNHEIGLNGNELKISSNPNTFFKINSDSLKLSSLDNINIVSGNLGWIDVSGNVSLYNSNRLNLYGSEAFSSTFPPPPARGFSILFDNLSFGQFIELRLPNQPGTLVTEDYVTNAVSGISGLESYTEGFDEDGFYNLVIKDPNNANAARIEVVGEDGSIFLKGGVLLSASEAEFQAGRYFRYNYSNLTSGRTHNAPDANGTYTLSVAGVAADVNGNVPLTLNDLGGSSSSGHTIQFNGVDSPTQPNLNFKGAVSVENNAPNESVDVTFQVQGGISPNTQRDVLVATGGETTFTLSQTPVNSTLNMLFRGSALIDDSDYDLNGNVLTLSGLAVPTAGEKLKFYYNTANNNYVDHPTYPVYADNAAAIAGGLEVDDVYKTVMGAMHQVFEAPAVTEARFIMVGNSITQDVFAATATMKSKVETAYPSATVTFFEEGTDGIRATQVDDQIATILNNYSPVTEPTYVVVTLGTNDISPIRPYSTALQTDIDAYSLALDDILDEIESRGYIPVLNEVYYANYDASTFNNQEQGSLPFNEQIVRPKILARTPNFAYNDGTSFYQSYNLFYNNRDTWFIDTLHPNATGVEGFQDHFVATIAHKIFTGNDPVLVPIDNTDADQDGNPITTDPDDSVAQTAPDSFSAQAEIPTTFDILANDDFIASASTTISIEGGTAAGTISLSQLTGELTYTSTAAEEGTTVTIDYRIEYNPSGVFGTNTVTINVTGELDTDAQAYISAVGSLTQAQQTAYNNLIVGLKADGVWDDLYMLTSLVNGSEAANRWNIKDPRDLDAAYRMTWSGSLTTTASGMTSDGSTGYGDTHLPFNTHGATDFTFGFYSGTDTGTTAGYEMGSNSFGQGVRLDLVESGNHQFVIQGLEVENPATNSLGLFLGTRTSSTDMRLYKNGVEIASDATSTNPTPSSQSSYVFCINNNGSAFNFSNLQCKFIVVAQGLTATEAANITTRIEAFLDELGFGSVN